MRCLSMAALLGAGCLGVFGGAQDTAEPPCVAQDELRWRGELLDVPTAWDPIFLTLDTPDCGYPFFVGDEAYSIVDPDGTLTPLVPCDWGDRDECLVGETPLEPGVHTGVVAHRVFLGAEGVKDVQAETTYEVFDHGRVPDFDAAGLAGQAVLLERPLRISRGAGEMLERYMVGDVWLEIIAVGDGSADFRLIQGLEDDAACVYLEARADLSETGELWWETDEIDLATTPPLPAYDMSLHLGFNADYEVAGLELMTMLDLVNLTGMSGEPPDEEPLDWEDYCNTAAAFGQLCEACPQGELESCIPVEFYANRGSPAPLPWDSDTLPACDVVLDTDLPSCDWGCSAAPRHQVPLVLLGLLGVALVRRRRAVSL